jgi:HK97 family phage major capsid protein
VGELQKVAEELRDSWERDLKPRIDETKKAVDAVQDRMDTLEAQGQKAGLGGGRTDRVKGTGPFLGLESKAAPHFKSEGTQDYRAENVRLGALLAGALYPADVKGLLNEDEVKALNILVDPSGGLLIPSVIGSLFIDAVRPKTQVLAAGARTYPMEARNVLLPGWDTPPKAGWRGERGTFADAGASFRSIELNARDIGCFLDIPNNLFEDQAPNIDAISTLIEDQLSKAIAQGIDLAALLSQDATNAAGATHIPQGLASVAADTSVSANYGINLATSSGTNGGTPNYDWYIDAAAAVAGANFTATGHLSAPRTFASLGKQKDSQLRYLARPEYLSNVRDYETNQVPTTLKKGSSTNSSVSFVGDFTQMVVGLRGEMGILRDPYTQGTGRVTRLIVWSRADVAVLNKGAFQIVDGVTP